jgi:hypothetical protein
VSTLYQFHVNVFARDDAAPFAVTWEDAATMLERLPRMIFEPDGSFVVSGSFEQPGLPSVSERAASPSAFERAGSSSTPAQEAHRWQVNGHLFDFAGRLHRMELRGRCPPEAFDTLLACVGWPAQALAFEMVRAGTTLEETAFRRQAGGGDAPAR